MWFLPSGVLTSPNLAVAIHGCLTGSWWIVPQTSQWWVVFFRPKNTGCKEQSGLCLPLPPVSPLLTAVGWCEGRERSPGFAPATAGWAQLGKVKEWNWTPQAQDQHYGLRPVHSTQGVCPAQPSETSLWLKCHRLKDKQDQRRDNPYPRLPPNPPISHLSGQPGLVSCCLWLVGVEVEVGHGVAWAWPRQPPPLARPRSPASVAWLATLEPVSGREVTSQCVCPNTLSMDKSESSNHHWGGQSMLVSGFNDNQFSPWLFAK